MISFSSGSNLPGLFLNSMTTINPVLPSELPLLRSIAIQTFEETYPEDAQRTLYIHNNYSTEALEKELHSPDTDCFFARKEGKVAGFMKLVNFRSPPFLEGSNTELSRIYVLKSFQGQQTGTDLLEFALEYARQKQSRYLWLLVWEGNYKGIQFYQKHGFHLVGRMPFLYGAVWEEDYVYAIEI